MQAKTNSSANASTDPNDVFTIKSTADWVSASKDLESLYRESDLVMLANITKVDYQAAKGGLIFSNFIPNVVETYKGSYDGRPIKSIGGIVDFSQYIKNDDDPNTVKQFTTPSGVQPKKVQLIFDEIYVVKPGEQYLLFLKNNNGELNITNSYQGLFKVNGNTLSNKALKATENITKDIEGKAGVNGKTLGDGVDKTKFIDTLKKLKSNSK